MGCANDNSILLKQIDNDINSMKKSVNNKKK